MIRLFLICGLLALPALALDKGQTVFVKRDQVPLLSAASPDSEPISKLQWGKSYSIKAVEGRWVQLAVDGKTGWVYSGNLATEKPAESTAKDSLPASSAQVSTSLAARGLDDAAHAYAGRHGHENAPGDLVWLEQQNAQVNKAAAIQYLKDRKQGEYAGGAK